MKTAQRTKETCFVEHVAKHVSTMRALARGVTCGVASLAVASLMLAGAATTAAPAHAANNAAGGYSLPASMTIKVGESKVLELKEPAGKYANVSFQYNPNYVVASDYCAGSYWGKKARITLTGKKPGCFCAIAGAEAHSKAGVAQSSIGDYRVYCNVTVVSAQKSKADEQAVKTTTKRPLKSISLSKSTATLEVGKTLKLGVTYNPANTTDPKNVEWTTSNAAVASVSRGTVKAKKAGVAKVTAKVGTKSATCTITVKAKQAAKPKDGYVSVSYCYKELGAFRSAAKVHGLAKSAKLEAYAKTRAKELVKKCSHTRPNGKDCLDGIHALGFVIGGENIALAPSAEVAMKLWYESKGHYTNMVSAKYKHVGMAGYRHNGQTYWVQVFGS